MSTNFEVNDPAMMGSGEDRLTLDQYYTEHWITSALMQVLGDDIPQCIWEPAAGRGDMTGALRDWGVDVISSDVDMSKFDEALGPAFQNNFLLMNEPPANAQFGQTRGIITNPPYNTPRGIGEHFCRHAISMMLRDDHIEFVAMLMRSEFCHAKSRRDIFGECDHYFGEVVLTKRPRWDWWFRDKPVAAPRHNFSWFVWIENCDKPSSQFFHYA